MVFQIFLQTRRSPDNCGQCSAGTTHSHHNHKGNSTKKLGLDGAAWLCRGPLDLAAPSLWWHGAIQMSWCPALHRCGLNRYLNSLFDKHERRGQSVTGSQTPCGPLRRRCRSFPHLEHSHRRPSRLGLAFVSCLLHYPVLKLTAAAAAATTTTTTTSLARSQREETTTIV